MFKYDKDMERLMLAKKKEVLKEIETAKKNVVNELYALKRSIHTDLCGMLADYNNIVFTLNKTNDDVKNELKKMMKDYNGIVTSKFEELDAAFDMKINEINAKYDALSALMNDTQTLFNDGNKYLCHPDWSENDEANGAYIENRTHYVTLEEGSLGSRTFAMGSATDESGTVYTRTITNGTYKALCDENNTLSETFKVIFNDVEYNAKNHGYYIGNGYLAGYMGGDDVPFCLTISPTTSSLTLYTSTMDAGTIEAFAIVENVTPLDIKFVPDEITKPLKFNADAFQIKALNGSYYMVYLDTSGAVKTTKLS